MTIRLLLPSIQEQFINQSTQRESLIRLNYLIHGKPH